MQFSFMSLSAAAVRQYTKTHSARRLSECLCGCVCVCGCLVGLQWSPQHWQTAAGAAVATPTTTTMITSWNAKYPNPIRRRTSWRMCVICGRTRQQLPYFRPNYCVHFRTHTLCPLSLVFPLPLCLHLSLVILLRLKLLILLSPKLHIYAGV